MELEEGVGGGRGGRRGQYEVVVAGGGRAERGFVVSKCGEYASGETSFPAIEEGGAKQ